MYEILDYKLNKYWKNLLIENNVHSVIFSPEYLRLWELNGDGKANLFFHKSYYGIVLYSFLIRKISTLEFLQQKNLYSDFYDITTPYGYGGPLVKPDSGDNRNLLVNEFRKNFAIFCRKNNIITEFIRFHPLMENHLDFITDLDIEKMNSIIYVDLSLTESEIWRNYKANNRKNIKKALKNNIEIIVDEKFNYFDEFLDIYYETMKRNSANSYYFFSKNFFEFIRVNLNNNYVLFASEVNNKIVSVELAIYDKDIIYSFLGGSIPDYFSLRPNNLLKHELILWAKKRNIKYYFIGGGYHPGDGIFNYKHSFSKNGIKDFFVGRKIHNIEKYKMLEAESKKYLLSIYSSIDLKEIKYFPIYRYVL